MCRCGVGRLIQYGFTLFNNPTVGNHSQILGLENTQKDGATSTHFDRMMSTAAFREQQNLSRAVNWF
jgi:hypothetical protein